MFEHQWSGLLRGRRNQMPAALSSCRQERIEIYLCNPNAASFPVGAESKVREHTRRAPLIDQRFADTDSFCCLFD